MTESFNRKLGRLAQSVSGTGSITTNAATASAWETARTITLGGDLSGNVSIDGTQNVTLTATVSGDSIVLGTDTTGDYVATVSAGSGITVTGTGEGAAVTVSIDSTVTTLTGEQTLTNKTISGATNTISNIGNSSLTNSSITINGTAVSLGGTRTLVTDDVGEDASPVNLWFTDTRARNSVSATDAGGDGSFTYDSGTGVFTYTGPSASEVRAHFSGGTGVTITNGEVSIGQAVGTSSNVTFNDVVVSGNLTVSGTTTTINTETLNLADNIVVFNSNETGTPSQDAGIEIERGTSPNVSLLWDETNDRWTVGSQNFLANTFIGALSGNATTATTLQTARNINGVSFNGSADITVADSTKLPLAGGTMTGAIVMSQAADWYMYGLGTRGASAGAYGIGLTSDIANRTLSYHVPNHAAYSSSGAVPKFGWYSNGADELMTLQSATGNLVVKGSVTATSTTLSGSATLNTSDGEIIVSPTGWRSTDRAAIKIRSKADAPAEIDLRHTSGGIESGWHLSARSAAEAGPLNFYKFNMNASGASDSSGFNLMASLSAGGAFNAVGAITQNGNQVLHAGNYNSYAPTLTGTGASGTWSININGVINTTVPGGSVLIKHSVSEADAWIFQENAANWGLYWKNAPTGQHTFGGYTSVGAELVGMSAINASGNGVATTNYVGATSAIAQWMISSHTGYIWSASTIYAATSMVVGGNTVLHAGNYTSYVNYGNPSTRGAYQITNWNQTTYPNTHFLSSENSTTNAPTTDFTYGLQYSFHRDGAGYRTQMVTSLYSDLNIWVRNSRDNDVWTAWKVLLHSGNYSSYALPLSGGTLTGQLNANAKRTNFGVSGNWDGAGFSQQTNVHMQGHDHFWIGAGNAYWYRGAIATEHDLLITTMLGYDSTSYYRGITFAVENTGAGNSGYRLGRWQTYGSSWIDTRLQVDASLCVGYGARGTNSDYLDYDASYWPLDRGVWRHGVNETGYGDRRGYIFSPSGNGGGPWGSFVSLEVSTPYRSGTLDIPALFRMHQWGSGSAEFWKPYGTILYLRESPIDGSIKHGSWFTKFVVQRTIESDTEVRAPIFKDTDNDAYYLNLAGDGTQAANINGNIRINPKSETWAEGISFNMPTQATWGGLRWVRSYSGSFTGNWALGYLGSESSNDMAWWSGDNSVKWRLDHSGNMTATGNVTAYSDIRLKKNIQRIDNAIEKVNKINGYTFERTDVQTPMRQAGVIAQEVLEVLPEVVLGSEETQYSVAYGNMVGLLIEAIKEQDVKIENLKQQIKKLLEEQ